MSERPSSLPLGLREFAVTGVPSSVYYVPDFLPPSTCKSIWTSIQSTPPQKWVKLSHRRLLTFGGLLTGTARDTLFCPTSLPSFLTDVVFSKLEGLAIFAGSPHGEPNHVLVNEYLPGQGIMPHEDGPVYHPVTATVSLGSSTVLDIYSKFRPEVNNNERQHWRILQEPGSLLVTREECYVNTLHGIAEVKVDEAIGDRTIANWELLGEKGPYLDGKNTRGPRVSLTYRDVKKVMRRPIGVKIP